MESKFLNASIDILASIISAVISDGFKGENAESILSKGGVDFIIIFKLIE